MSTSIVLSLAFISYFSLSFCTPLSDNHRQPSRHLSDTPPTRRIYSPTRHSTYKNIPLHQFPTSTRSHNSHVLPSSPSAAPTSKFPNSHQPSIDDQDPQTPQSFLSAITSSLARIFNFHQETTPEPTPEQSLATEIPADNEPETQHIFSSHHHPHQHRYLSQSAQTRLETQDHLQRAKRLVEDALSQVDTSSDEDLSPEELFQMVHLWTRMFQAIEQVLTQREISSSPTPSASANTENQVDQESSAHDPVTETDNIAEMHRNTLPDVKIALAQAEQLNKQRENERQQKLSEFEKGQANNPDYTDGLPKSAPSYPTRLRLQMEARSEQWPGVR